MPVASSDGVLEAGPEPAGTVFTASATEDGQTYTAQTSQWQGTVQATALPTLVGVARVGASVTPAAGRWAGGWGTENELLGVEACKQRSGTNCVVLSSNCGCYPESGPGATVGGWFAGWYLFATDQRVPHPQFSAGIFYNVPAAVPPPEPGATVAHSAPVGPVSGPPAPSAKVLGRAVLRGGYEMLARVKCASRCHVSLTVATVPNGTLSLFVNGSRLIGIERRRLAHRSAVAVELTVAGGPIISGMTRLG
jgi:hypothetical protein